MTALTSSVPSRAAGLDMQAAACTAVSAEDTFSPGDDTFLYVRSTNSGAVTVTVAMAAGDGPSGTTISDYALAPAVDAATGERLYGPFPSGAFAQTTDGLVHVTYSSTTGVAVRVVKAS